MNKKYLIVGDFQSRMGFYLKAVNEAEKKNKSIIILVPDLRLIPYFTKYLKNSVAILHSQMTKTERWLTWNRIRNQKVKIIIGSQSALFAPVKNLGLIIIDQEENETFKNNRSPRFHAVDAAERLGLLSGASLILGSLSPRIETYYKGLKGDFKIFKKTQKDNLATIVDMNSEKYVISNTLEQEIEEALRNKEKILLIFNRKGEGTKFSCVDCGFIALCEKCGLPLIPQKSENVCYRCQKTTPLPAICPKCQSVKLKPMGLGTARLKKFLSDLFLKVTIVQIEKELDGTALKADWQIAIATSYALKFQFPKLGLVALIDADQGLNFPDFFATEKSFGNLYKFLRIGKVKIIQTHLPENKVIKNLAKMDYEGFFLDEIAERKKFAFPPFRKIIRLEYRDDNYEEAFAQASRIYLVLKKNGLEPTAPYTPYIGQIRNLHRVQMLVKYQKNLSIETKTLIKNLKRPWIIDVDPIKLL